MLCALVKFAGAFAELHGCVTFNVGVLVPGNCVVRSKPAEVVHGWILPKLPVSILRDRDG